MQDKIVEILNELKLVRVAIQINRGGAWLQFDRDQANLLTLSGMGQPCPRFVQARTVQVRVLRR